MASGGFRETFLQLVKARFPILYVDTWEEHRFLGEVSAIASDPALMKTPRSVMTWSATEGLTTLAPAKGGRPADGTCATGTCPDDDTRALREALAKVSVPERPSIVVFRDAHPSLGNGHRPPDAEVVRRLRDIAHLYKTSPHPATLVLVSPVLNIPPELEKTITILDFPLPQEGELDALLQSMIDANAASGRVQVLLDARERERLVKAAAGLTLHEAENAFARAMVDDGVLSASDIDTVVDEKRQVIRKSGILDVVPVQLGLDQVGGLDTLKRWLQRREGTWLDDAAAYAVPPPKGVLLTGVPGCGKSLTAKAVSSAWELPLLRMDIGRVFAGIVGSSEHNMRTALRTAEAIAPCVLWIDELEKGFAGLDSGGDGGTSQRVFGTFLTWMQEKTAPVFVVATANDISNLPPEFLRRGRFDEIFFIDLPTRSERVPIWRLHLTRRQPKDPAMRLAVDDALLDALADASEGFSGAEIEQCVVIGLVDAFAERRPLTRDDLLRAVRNTVPLATMQAEQIASLRAWAALRAVSASAADDRTAYDEWPAETSAPTANGEASGRDQGPVAATRGGRVLDL